eukprot:365930-Chlamydomonas_euryale.AAC.8
MHRHVDCVVNGCCRASVHVSCRMKWSVHHHALRPALAVLPSGHDMIQMRQGLLAGRHSRRLPPSSAFGRARMASSRSRATLLRLGADWGDEASSSIGEAAVSAAAAPARRPLSAPAAMSAAAAAASASAAAGHGTPAASTLGTHSASTGSGCSTTKCPPRDSFRRSALCATRPPTVARLSSSSASADTPALASTARASSCSSAV